MRGFFHKNFLKVACVLLSIISNSTFSQYIQAKTNKKLQEITSQETQKKESSCFMRNIYHSLCRHKIIIASTLAVIISGIYIHCSYSQNSSINIISSQTHLSDKSETHIIECTICLEDKDTRDFCTLSCGHKGWCKDCLMNQVDLALKEKSTTCLKCPNPQCKKPMTEQDIRTITQNNRNTLTAYANITTKEWMLTQDNAKQCPTPNCQFLFINEDQNPQKIKCPQCTHEYCSNCLLPHSNHISCKKAEENRALNGNKTQTQAEKETAQWKNEHTKPCPHCKIIIEKIDGCNRILCNQCWKEFCFKCGKSYGHGTWDDNGHTCLIWDDPKKDVWWRKTHLPRHKSEYRANGGKMPDKDR